MTIPAGSRLGPYEIEGPLGAGGMGEVYRAKDSRVGRTVALKVLPEEFFDDRERRERFEREARTLASLSHPGIAVLYSFESVPGPAPSSSRHLLAMELVEGETLTGKTAKVRFLRRIPVDPFTNTADWGMRSISDDPTSTGWGGGNVYDVYSLASGTGSNEIPYREW